MMTMYFIMSRNSLCYSNVKQLAEQCSSHINCMNFNTDTLRTPDALCIIDWYVDISAGNGNWTTLQICAFRASFLSYLPLMQIIRIACFTQYNTLMQPLSLLHQPLTLYRLPSEFQIFGSRTGMMHEAHHNTLHYGVASRSSMLSFNWRGGLSLTLRALSLNLIDSVILRPFWLATEYGSSASWWEALNIGDLSSNDGSYRDVAKERSWPPIFSWSASAVVYERWNSYLKLFKSELISDHWTCLLNCF
jgi:hypothetical protein